MQEQSTSLVQKFFDYAPYSYIFLGLSILFWAAVLYFLFAWLRCRRAGGEPLGDGDE